MAKLIFWTSLLFILYTYAGYPLALYFLSRFRRKEVNKGEHFASVSVVIAALNEERNIGQRIENLLDQNYPRELLEIIVVSDGSTDRTEAVTVAFADRGVRLIALPTRSGKAIAVNRGVEVATGELIVFTDARQSFAPDAIRRLAENFHDSSVGCVSGELLFYEEGESRIKAEMGAYWRYEKWIRRVESATGSVIGATGAIYAIRAALYRPLPAGTILDDVLTPMNCVMQGYRTIFDASAHAFDIVSQNVEQEWRRKVRTLSGNWQFASLVPELFNPLLNSSFVRFLSHKIFRLVVPFFLLPLLAASLMVSGPLYGTIAALQIAAYGAVVSGGLFPTWRRFKIVNIAYFFAVLNLAAVVGFWRWVSGGCADAWRPAYRAAEGDA